jgi:hypothetical protein
MAPANIRLAGASTEADAVEHHPRLDQFIAARSQGRRHILAQPGQGQFLVPASNPVIVSEHRKGERGAYSSIKKIFAGLHELLPRDAHAQELWRLRLFVERRQESGLRDKTSHRTGVCPMHGTGEACVSKHKGFEGQSTYTAHARAAEKRI